MRTIEKTVYNFNELSDEAKDKAVNNLCDINVDYDWYQFTYEDASQIGCKIDGFDLCRGNYCNLEFVDSPDEVARQILASHGENCETYKTAKQFLSDRDNLVSQYSDGINTNVVSEDNETDFDNELDELEADFKKSLSEDYRIILSDEYDHLTSSEQIIETIEANQYEFDELGNMVWLGIVCVILT